VSGITVDADDEVLVSWRTRLTVLKAIVDTKWTVAYLAKNPEFIRVLEAFKVVGTISLRCSIKYLLIR